MQVKMRMLGNTNLIKVFSIAILAACSVQAGIPLDPDNLDQAWLAALALAHEAGMNHGRDIVFTYGPLGYTHPYQAYLPSTFSSYITGHLLVTAIQCIVIACAAASAHVGVFLSAVFAAPRRFVWNPTVRIAGHRRARWACGQAAFEPVHMSTGQLPGARN
jgi:hypothetical protein